MHCIQGSDAHRLTAESQRRKILGIGDRVTDVLLPEVSFEALRDLFLSNDFARTRPHRKKAEPAYDFIRAAREEGANIVQDFHESMSVRGGRLYAILADVCAFANTNGGTLYIGYSTDPKKSVAGISNIEQSIAHLEKEISDRVSPPFHCTIDAHQTGGKKVLRVLVPRGEDPPYVLDDYKIYVRAESETGMAVRDEIVGLVRRGQHEQIAVADQPAVLPTERTEPVEKDQVEEKQDIPPRTGVEVVAVEERSGGRYYTVRDLRNGNVVKNVTLKSARRLWHYAITQYDKIQPDPNKAKIQWDGDYGLLRRVKQGKRYRYDLVQRLSDSWRYYFGVNEDGIHGPWKKLLGQEDE